MPRPNPTIPLASLAEVMGKHRNNDGSYSGNLNVLLSRWIETRYGDDVARAFNDLQNAEQIATRTRQS